MGTDAPVFVRTGVEMEQVAKENPFAEEPGARVAAIFLEVAPPKTTIEETRGLADERWCSAAVRFMCTIPGALAHPPDEPIAFPNGAFERIAQR